jgi:hypothetical protein
MKDYIIYTIGMLLMFGLIILENWLIAHGNVHVVQLTTLVMMLWIILLYENSRKWKKSYNDLLSFSHKFYRGYKKINRDKHDCEDYNKMFYEEEFEDWKKAREKKHVKFNNNE